jgi:hypothetical protein
MIESITRHLFKENVNGKYIPVGGMLPNGEDERDFEYGIFGDLFTYHPKHDERIIKTFSTKDQSPYNNCVFQSYACSREPDEGVALSARSIVKYSRLKGYIKENGFSNLRSAQKAGVDFGIAEESLLPESHIPWQTYSAGGNDVIVTENAAIHKAKSFFRVIGRNQWLKALDENHTIHTGFTWRSSYNQTGGFKAPWILRWGYGVPVGGHAVCSKGYRKKGDLIVFQNSFGKDWGDKGDFYVPTDNLRNIEGYVALDLEPSTVAQLIQKYEGRDVKTNDSSAIYRIKNGKKCPYLNSQTFFMCGGTFDPPSYQIISGTLLSNVELGNPMP